MNSFTEEQAERFIEHLAECHSWYKHLSVLTGAEFILVVDPDAGRNYSPLHPSLPFGNTKEGYQKAFGFLNYYWGDCGSFCSDCQDSMETAGDESFSRKEIYARFPRHASIRLFPYVGGAFSDVLSAWEKGVNRIAHGYKHEKSEILIKLKDTIIEQNRLWQAMSDVERYDYVKWYNDDIPAEKMTLDQRRYKAQNDIAGEIHSKLRNGEIAKIRRAIILLRRHREE